MWIVRASCILSIPEVVFKNERYGRVAHCCTGGSLPDMFQNMGSEGWEFLHEFAPVHMQHMSCTFYSSTLLCTVQNKVLY